MLNVFLSQKHPSMHSLSEPFQLLIGPLFYLYLRKLNSATTRSLIQLSHFLPFIFAAIYLLLVLASEAGLLTGYNLTNKGINWLGFIVYIQLWFYYFLCHTQLKKYRTKLKLSCSTIEKINEAWIEQSLFILLLGYSCVTFIYLLNHGIYYLPVNKSLAVVFAVTIYLIAYRTIRRPEIFSGVRSDVDVPGPMVEELSQTGDLKYQKSGLKQDDVVEIYELVQKHMVKEKPFIDPELNLQSLAKQLDLSPHHLSQVINHGKSANFYDFINAYRIDEVKKQFSDPANKSRSIITIAYDAGFNSKATFNRIFKNVAHKTPSQYRKLHSVEP